MYIDIPFCKYVFLIKRLTKIIRCMRIFFYNILTVKGLYPRKIIFYLRKILG